MSICGKIEQFKTQVLDRWHTPGHKGLLWEDDITEIDDGKTFPFDSISLAEESVARFYGAKALRFLTGGSSMGIKAAVIAVDGDIIVFNGAHQSVFEATALNKVKALKVDLGEDNDFLPRLPSLEDIENALKTFKEAKAVFVTSPDYYGRVVSTKIVELVHSYNKVLIVDSAHGAHFPLVDSLKTLSFADKADFCNLSAHKTMYAMTMGAYLCINNEKLLAQANEALKNLGTTSPLYPLLSSLETAPIIGTLNKGNYDYILRCVNEIGEQIPLLKTDDFTRITVDAQKLANKTGKELFDSLYQEHQIAAEMYHKQYLVFIATHCDDESKFFRLKAALLDAKKV